MICTNLRNFFFPLAFHVYSLCIPSYAGTFLAYDFFYFVFLFFGV
ncbi:hypothetical protein I3843_04G051900 [Carya illinoinensis]|nr:hypothetical protein I3843_04G051900 [Carya illinoinensis]